MNTKKEKNGPFQTRLFLQTCFNLRPENFFQNIDEQKNVPSSTDPSLLTK